MADEQPAEVADVEAEALQHWAVAQAEVDAAAARAVITSPERLEQPQPSLQTETEAADVVEQEMLRLDVYCGGAARSVAGAHWGAVACKLCDRRLLAQGPGAIGVELCKRGRKQPKSA